jgi:DNA-binding transcriptional LysR family regulator
MHSFDGLVEFEATARRLSFTAAAAELELDATALGRRIRRLEARLGVRLLQRTTRTVALTEAGSAYLLSVRSILAQAAEADRAVTHLAKEPQGRLRVALPNLFGQTQIVPLLPEFMGRCPLLRLHLSFSDEMHDLVTDRMDCAVRIGALEAGGELVSRRLVANRRVLCAAPDYLRRAGMPADPEELRQHQLLHFRPLLGRGLWRLVGSDGQFAEIAVDPYLSSDNAEALRIAAVQGRGISLLATFVAGDDLRAGRLVRVMPGWNPRESQISFVYPNAPFVPQKVRALRDFLVERMLGTAVWDHGLDLI